MSTLRGLFFLLFFTLGAAISPASEVGFSNGTPGWSVSGGRCTFKVPAKILNSGDTTTGTLRLCLWVTAGPFPSIGYRAASYTLGRLKPGYQWSNINPSAAYSLPKLTGNYYFTVSLEEYTHSGWMTADVAPSSSVPLKKGVFVKPKKWTAPVGKIVAPRKSVLVGDILSYTLQGSAATGGSVYVSNGTIIKLTIQIQANGVTTVYGGSRPEGAVATYTYGTAKTTYGGKSYSTGKLSLRYGPETGYGTSEKSLFFQKSDKGFYKSIDNAMGAGGTSWGIFRID